MGDIIADLDMEKGITEILPTLDQIPEQFYVNLLEGTQGYSKHNVLDYGRHETKSQDENELETGAHYTLYAALNAPFHDDLTPSIDDPGG
jgi:hypothetical protein